MLVLLLLLLLVIAVVAVGSSVSVKIWYPTKGILGPCPSLEDALASPRRKLSSGEGPIFCPTESKYTCYGCLHRS